MKYLRLELQGPVTGFIRRMTKMGRLTGHQVSLYLRHPFGRKKQRSRSKNTGLALRFIAIIRMQPVLVFPGISHITSNR
jgi:hypothetical protein